MDEIWDILQIFISSVKKKMGNDLKKIILYGSYARGDYKSNSDIDIMILTSLEEKDIRKYEEDIADVAFDIQMSSGRDISVIVKNESQFNYWIGALPFYDNVEKDGVLLYG